MRASTVCHQGDDTRHVLMESTGDVAEIPSEGRIMQTPDTPSGDWHPLPDPAGRIVRLRRNGTELQGTVIEAEISPDRPTWLYVEVIAPEEHRSEHSLQVSEAQWVDDQGNDVEPWVESDIPTNRWVMLTDNNGNERLGIITEAELPGFGRVIFCVMETTQHTFGFHRVPWTRVKWLPT